MMMIKRALSMLVKVKRARNKRRRAHNKRKMTLRNPIAKEGSLHRSP